MGTERIVALGGAVLLVAEMAGGAAAAPRFAGTIDRELRRYVVAVGVGTFEAERPPGPGRGPEWARLDYATKDALDVVSGLADYGFEPYPPGPITDRQATRAAVWAQLDALREEIQRAPHADFELIVYFSSHGFEYGGEGWIVTWDTPPEEELEPDVPPKAIGQREIQEDFVERLGPNVRHVAVIYDACFVAGGKAPEHRLKGSPLDVVGDLEAAHEASEASPSPGRSTFVLASVSPGQRAAESGRLENSVYTHYLVEALQRSPRYVRERPLRTPGASLFGAHLWAAGQVMADRGYQQVPSWSAPLANEGSALFFLESCRASRACRPEMGVLRGPGIPGYDVFVRSAAGGRAKAADPGGEAWSTRLTVGGAQLPGPGRYDVEIVDGHSGAVIHRQARTVAPHGVLDVNVWRSLYERTRHETGLRGGATYPVDAWGAGTGLRPTALLGLHHRLYGWPGRSWAWEGSLELGTAIGAISGGQPRVREQRARVSSGFLWVGERRQLGLQAGPVTVVELVHREVDGLDDPVRAMSWGVGALVRGTVRLGRRWQLALAGRSSVQLVGSGAQGTVGLSATLGISYRWRTNLP